MAQRAYRHRKETTISSLEKQVEKLQSTTEEMNNVFISLYDFAVSKGLLQREPEFGQHLQSTTQRFLVLAKSAATDEQGHDEDPNHPEGKLGNNDADADCGREQQSQQQPSPEDEANTTMPSVIWGYQISKAESPENEYDLQQYYNQTHIPLNHLTEHQIISRTTPGNSGFSIDLSDSKIEQWRAEIPDMDAQYQFAAGLGSDYRSIRPPSSFAHSEASFARRLQRTANERGFLLITSPDANPKILKRVFGLSLRFHTKEDLADALKKAVSQCSTKEPLSNWRAPFVHLGGAGTYYPLAQDDVTSDLMPKLRTGRSMGPFTSTVMEGREKYMVDDFRSSATGFEGKYFDANDVEGYLRGKGIDIPPNTEYITVNLDMISLQDVASPPPVPTPVSLSAKGRNSISLSPKTPVSPNRGELSKSEQSSQASSIEALMGGMQGASGGLTTASGYIDPSIAALPGGFTDWMNASNTNLTSTNNKLSPDLNAFDLTGPVFNTGSIPQPSTPYDRYDSSASDNPRMVTFSVSTLVECTYTSFQNMCRAGCLIAFTDITRRGVCLGRAPGFRPQDVDLAIRRTIQDSF